MSWNCEGCMEALGSRSYIFITGGAGGIGSSLCRILPAHGITPIVGFNTNATQAHILAKELNGFAINIDMSENNSIEKAIQSIFEKIKPSDSFLGVVLGASPPPEIKPFKDISSDDLAYQFRVNVIGSQLLLKGLIKKFFHKKKAGIVIGILTKAIGSDDHPPASGMAAYVIAKSALNSLLSVCSAEYPWLKIGSVTPGFTKTPMLDVFDPRFLEAIEAKDKIAAPEEVAQLIIEMIKS